MSKPSEAHINPEHTPDLSTVFHRAQRAARAYKSTIMLLGETGVGKTLLARYIHACSGRADQPFVKIDISQVTDALFEDDLFGHDRGAYTGAGSARQSLLETADGGTVFLDEIGTTPLHLQARLMRLVEEGTFRRLGGNKEIQVDVRIIAATSHNLLKMVQEGRFREDLYYRLNVVQIDIPPLRDRPRDILLLADHFLEKASRKDQLTVKPLSDATKKLLLTHTWPGNVRNLEHSISCALIMADGDKIEPSDFQFYENHNVSQDTDPLVEKLVSKYPPLKDIVQAMDPLTQLENISDIESEHRACVRQVISCILSRCSFSIQGAASFLGCSRSALSARITTYFSLQKQTKEDLRTALEGYQSNGETLPLLSATTEVCQAVIEMNIGSDSKLAMIDDIFEYVKIFRIMDALHSHGYVQAYASRAVGWTESVMSNFVRKNPVLRDFISAGKEKEKFLNQGAQPSP